jgi:transposase
LRCHGDYEARAAVYGNRGRLRRSASRPCANAAKWSSAAILDRGGMRHAWLRGRVNVHKRHLIHVARFNIGILMRAMFGKGREAASAKSVVSFVIQTDSALAIAAISAIDGENGMLVIIIAP